MKLTGNTILITGGTSGIGQAFAVELLHRGNTVIICGRRKERLDAMKVQYPAIITKECDVANAGEREEMASWVTTHYPALNIVMNNAGIQLPTDLTKPVDIAAVQEEITTNLVAPIHLGSLLVQHLQQQPSAALINITSGLAFVPIAFMPVYCATKAALHSLTLSWRHQLRNTNVKVIEIAPPSTDTELGHQRRADKTQSHGGLPIADFLKEAMEALENDVLEATIAQSKGLRAKGEQMFEAMNSHFG